MRNLLSLLFLVACGTTEPSESGTTTTSTVEIDVGECEGSASRVAMPTDTGAPVPSVSVEVSADSRLLVHLEDMSANCCPSPGATFTTSGSSVTVDFHDTTDSSVCDCNCVTDFDVTSEPFAAGDYDVEVIYDDVSQGTYAVTVP